MNLKIESGPVAGPQRVVVYGPEGIGKSTLASQFHSPLFFDVEGGTGHLAVSRVTGILSWQELMDGVAAARTEGYRTVVIDTADAAERLLFRHVCDKNRWNSIETPGYGKGYQVASEEFGRFLDLLSRIVEAGKNVVVIAHAATRKFELPESLDTYDRWEMKLSKRTAPMLKEWADAVLFVNYKIIVETDNGQTRARGGKRVILTEHAATYDAKNRWGLPAEIPLEREGTYEKFIAPHCAPDAAAMPPPEAPFRRAKAEKPAPAAEYDESGPVPTEAPTPAPAPEEVPDEPEEAPPPETRHPALRKLMAADGITDAQLRALVGKKGYYTASVPVEEYDDDFVNGCLVACWPQIRGLLLNP